MTEDEAVLYMKGFRNILKHGILTRELSNEPVTVADHLQIEAFDKVINISEKSLKAKRSRAKIIKSEV